ncbi:MAG TPA: threonine ammonia-lyase [Thermoanaerobaculia bacterium]|nr:threonine ammonia-lyase [Thermoanaerobaculia bacterium]
MISLQDIHAARSRIAAGIVETPCIAAPRLSEALQATVLLKCETLQRTGSFKARGALNKILTLGEQERRRGVIAASAGNHAQGVAFAAARVGIPALIVMPELTPLVKVSHTRRWGAEVVLHGEGFDDAVARARELQEERGMAFVHAFEDEAILAGQGTLGVELLEQVPGLEVLVVPIGGGGLISGVARAVKELRPGVRVYGVQSDAAPSMQRSFAAGSRIEVPVGRTIAEGISVKRPGELTFDYIRELVDDVLLVSELEIEEAVFSLLESQKLVTEGAGAATYAALLEGRVPNLSGCTVVAVLSGANIDLNILSRLIERALVRHARFTRLRLVISDRPGSLAGALAIVARCGASVLRISHNRFFTDSSFWETEVELTLETRDHAQVDELLRSLRDAGYSRIEQPDLKLVAAPIQPFG